MSKFNDIPTINVRIPDLIPTKLSNDELNDRRTFPYESQEKRQIESNYLLQDEHLSQYIKSLFYRNTFNIELTSQLQVHSIFVKALRAKYCWPYMV